MWTLVFFDPPSPESVEEKGFFGIVISNIAWNYLATEHTQKHAELH